MIRPPSLQACAGKRLSAQLRDPEPSHVGLTHAESDENGGVGGVITVYLHLGRAVIVTGEIRKPDNDNLVFLSTAAGAKATRTYTAERAPAVLSCYRLKKGLLSR